MMMRLGYQGPLSGNLITGPIILDRMKGMMIHNWDSMQWFVPLLWEDKTRTLFAYYSIYGVMNESTIERGVSGICKVVITWSMV